MNFFITLKPITSSWATDGEADEQKECEPSKQNKSQDFWLHLLWFLKLDNHPHNIENEKKRYEIKLNEEM